MPEPTSPSTPRPWSSRFEGSLHPQIARFNASISFDIRLLPYEVAGSLAHVQMLGACGILSREEAEQIRQGLEQIQKEAAEGSFQPDPEAEDVHYAVERRLVALVGEVGKKLHTGRSRNDQVATDLRLYLRDQIDAIRHSLWELRGVLLELASQHVETILPGYTHLQRAQPVSLAHHLLAYEEMFWRDWQRLGRVREEVNVCPWDLGR
jgi:argininosuccinate lyase